MTQIFIPCRNGLSLLSFESICRVIVVPYQFFPFTHIIAYRQTNWANRKSFGYRSATFTQVSLPSQRPVSGHFFYTHKQKVWSFFTCEQDLQLTAIKTVSYSANKVQTGLFSELEVLFKWNRKFFKPWKTDGHLDWGSRKLNEKREEKGWTTKSKFNVIYGPKLLCVGEFLSNT